MILTQAEWAGGLAFLGICALFAIGHAVLRHRKDDDHDEGTLEPPNIPAVRPGVRAVLHHIHRHRRPGETPDWGLAFIVELGWLAFVLVTVYAVALIIKAVGEDKEHAQRVAVSDRRQTGAIVEVL